MELPADAMADAAASDLAAAEQLWYDLEPPDGVRAELLDGELVLSPAQTVLHSVAVFRLFSQLVKPAGRQNWVLHRFLAVHLPPARDRLMPDLMVAAADAQRFSEVELLSSGVLLAAEVVSPSSRRRDRVAKPPAYARGGIPLCLLIDPFAGPAAVTLLRQPGPAGYAREETAVAGEPLHLPAPFDPDLGTAQLLAG